MGETSPGSARWMGVGRSSETDASVAAVTATRRALTGADPRLLVVFAAVGYDPAALVAGIPEAAPGGPVIGCPTNGETPPAGPRARPRLGPPVPGPAPCPGTP